VLIDDFGLKRLKVKVTVLENGKVWVALLSRLMQDLTRMSLMHTVCDNVGFKVSDHFWYWLAGATLEEGP